METSLEPEPEKMRDLYVDIIRKVRKIISIPVIIKIGKYFNNIPAVVNTLQINGAQGVVLFNRF